MSQPRSQKTQKRSIKPTSDLREAAVDPVNPLGDFLLALALFIIALALFWPAFRFDFLTYDDPMYVTDNGHVQSGLSASNVVWAFTTMHASNWHPLTWLSLMLDVSIGGVQPGVFHVTNVVLHALTSVLLWFAFLRMTGSRWRSGLVAVLFAIHPLHVESVAWIAERKDVLSTFFAVIALWCYASYAREGGWTRYAIVVLAFACSLLAKPMLVTFPFVLLLLDIWPLKRVHLTSRDDVAEQTIAPRITWAKAIIEKLPLFVLSLASVVITMQAQRAGGAMRMLEPVAPINRVGNAVMSYVLYLRDTFWPANLAVLYPHPGSWPVAMITIAAIVLVCITALALWRWKRDPHLLIGWLWYLGTLVPVIGLVQVGEQSRADRYTYVPLIGIFIMAAWSIPATRLRSQQAKLAVSASVAAALLALTVVTRIQLQHWHNSRTLFAHALAVTAKNATAHSNFGNEIARDGDLEAALEHYQTAIQINPNLAEAHSGIGDILLSREDYAQAKSNYLAALQHNPDLAAAHSGLGAIYAHEQKWNEAIAEFERVLQLAPSTKNLYANLGMLYAMRGRASDAIAMYRQALQRSPNNMEIWANLAAAYAAQQQYTNATEAARYACQLALAAGDQNFAMNMQNLMNEYQRLAAIGPAGATK